MDISNTERFECAVHMAELTSSVPNDIGFFRDMSINDIEFPAIPGKFGIGWYDKSAVVVAVRGIHGSYDNIIEDRELMRFSGEFFGYLVYVSLNRFI